MSSNLLSNLRVAVIGGGISGVATAASLFKVGCKRVTVYDKQPSLSALHSAHPPAAVLQANGARVLDALDLLPSLSASAVPIHRITQRNARGDLLSSFSPSTFLHARTKDGRALTSLASHYSDLHSAIASSLPSSALQWGKEVETVERGESGYQISFTSSPEVRADLIVAADGADSTIRNNFVYGRPVPPQTMPGFLVEGVSKGAVWGGAEGTTSCWRCGATGRGSALCGCWTAACIGMPPSPSRPRTQPGRQTRSPLRSHRCPCG